MRHLILFVIVILIAGCSTLRDSVLLGAGMGGAAGLGLGVAVEPSLGSGLIGLGIGGLLGAGFGYLGHKGEEKRTQQLLNAKKPESPKSIPSILPPETQCIVKEERIEGTKYFGPQTICTIERAAVWSR